MNVPHIRILHDQWAVFIAPTVPVLPTCRVQCLRHPGKHSFSLPSSRLR
jgi:hypothetical protein